MSLQRDEAGLETILLRLMIVAVVAALSIIPASEALGALEDKQFLKAAGEQLNLIRAKAEQLAMEGPWNVATLSLDFRGGGDGLRFERVVIGDSADGTNMSSVVLWLSNGACMVRSAAEPPAWLRADDGGALEITSPVFALRMSCHLEDGVEYVLVRAL